MAIGELEANLGKELGNRVSFCQADFLSWDGWRKHAGYDCIVMNPPFAAGKSRHLRLSRTNPETLLEEIRYVPIEFAFVTKAIDILSEGGRLLAVLPSSVAMSDSGQWLRQSMMNQGSIKLVHELPPKCFPGVESRMYLFVFEKGTRQGRITLLNHDLSNPERLTVPVKKLEGSARLDYGFHRALGRVDLMVGCHDLEWEKVKAAATVIRGDIRDTCKRRFVVHTTNFRRGFWRRSELHDKSLARNRERTIRLGDLLASRVGRNSSASFGRPVSITGMPCSDCVLMIRPHSREYSLKLLFCLQVLLRDPWLRPLLERGTGACYLSTTALSELIVPIGITRRFKKQFNLFLTGQSKRSHEVASAAVDEAHHRLSRLLIGHNGLV